MLASRRNRHSVDAWPGFVDALASVLLVFVFMLMIFVLGQYFLTDVLLGRDRALEILKQEVAQLADTLSMSEETSARHEEEIFSLRGRLDASLKAKQQLTTKLDEAQTKLAFSEEKLMTGEKQLEIKLRELASLQQDINSLRTLRQQLESRVALLTTASAEKDQQIAGLDQQLTTSKALSLTQQNQLSQLNADSATQQQQLAELGSQLGNLRDRSKALETTLADSQERTLLAQKEIDQRDIRILDLAAHIEDTNSALSKEQTLSETRRNEVLELSRQMTALQEQLSALSSTLELSQQKVSIQKVELDKLTGRLNIELARKVKELGRYRSEFFGKLREVLGDHPDIRIDGDRFTFQSELLFQSAADEIGDNGKLQLKKLAQTLIEISKKIPSEIEWVLRVDGHTDKRPISTNRFPTNWELSTARAVSIVKFLIDQGIPPTRLAATGFGEFHPLDPGENQQAYDKNRRIEIKLTGR